MGGRRSVALLLSVILTGVVTVAQSSVAGADTQGPINFEGYSVGSVNGQDGWTSTGSFDQGISDNSTLPGAPVSFGTKSFRISDSVTSGSFSDQTFSKRTVDAAGEAGADTGGFSTGTLQSRFVSSFDFASVTPAAEQAGLHLSVSPDRGDGARMSYVRIEDSASGWNLFFDDFRDVAPLGSGGNLDDGCSTGDDFTDIPIATGVSRSPHNLQFIVDLVPGPHNDVVKIKLDGSVLITGTTWEDYYRYCSESGGGTGGPLADKSRIVSRLLFREGGTANPANAGKGFLFDNFTETTGPGPVVVPVTENDLAPNGPWKLEPTSNTGSFSFVAGPGTPPSGTGSLALSIASGQHEWLNNYAYGLCATGPSCNSPASQVPIANFDALGYSTYRASGSTLPTFNMEIFRTGSSGYTTLVFVPNSGSITNGVWQSWDALNAGDGVWYSSQNLGTGVFNCAAFSCSASWPQIVASYPSAKVAFGLGPNVGTGGTFNGNVDNFTVGVSGATKVFNFEPISCTTTCYVNPSGNDGDSGTQLFPLKTIQAGINKVQSGGTVAVSAGTFVENVTVNKTAHVQGAGATTIVQPATSNPNCGGGGGGSLCTGASNVFLVQANGVEIDQLTVDGDNPSLSGLSIGGADVDARNGIITNHNAGTFNALSVHDVTVKNIYLRGMYASSGGTFTFSNNVVDNVQGEAASIGIFNFNGSGTISGNQVSHTNDAISSNHSAGIQFLNNTVTTSGSGVHTDNAGDHGGPADVISGNNVSACTAGGYGVWEFVPYIAPTISNNTVSGCDVGLGAFASCFLAGTNNCPGGVVPTVNFTGNQVTGTAGGLGLYISTTSFGFGDGDVKVQADHNTISGADDGVYVEETGTAVATTTVTRNSIGGNTTHSINNTGSTTMDATCNWWGSSSPAPFASGKAVGPATVAPWLITSDLNGNCIPILKIGATTPIRVTEGDAGTTPGTFYLVLDRPSSNNITVQWTTVNGTATAPSDFVAASGTVTFTAGQTVQTITVNINGDLAVEGKEKFTVHLFGATGPVVVAQHDKNFTILDDD